VHLTFPRVTVGTLPCLPSPLPFVSLGYTAPTGRFVQRLTRYALGPHAHRLRFGAVSICFCLLLDGTICCGVGLLQTQYMPFALRCYLPRGLFANVHTFPRLTLLPMAARLRFGCGTTTFYTFDTNFIWLLVPRFAVQRTTVSAFQAGFGTYGCFPYGSMAFPHRRVADPAFTFDSCSPWDSVVVRSGLGG
jgi:hypothetical protein